MTDLYAELLAAKKEFKDLSVRACNGLINSGLMNRVAVEAYVDEHGATALLRIPNFGRKALTEVMAWLGRPLVTAPQQPSAATDLRAAVARWAAGELPAEDAMRQIQAALTRREQNKDGA